ncbi:MAG: DUF4202 domain-containing protein [Leptospirales bacterium]|nr:DUF4202 domain-containing protein [Leptospirales bacterium]
MQDREEMLKAVHAAIDRANSEDPQRDGEDGSAKALLYGRRMTTTLLAIEPAANLALCIAARGQHIRRWKIPRDTYPRDRAGYHRWRTDLQRFHAAELREILTALQFAEELILRVEALVQKRNLRQDSEVQLLEDVICLVFLSHYALEFAAQHDPVKTADILRKTAAKMSLAGRERALAWPMPAAVREIWLQCASGNPAEA